MRTFFSYGPINSALHYHAPRERLIETGISRLTGDVPNEGGNYITVWAPHQCGKTWIIQQALHRIREINEYHTGMFSIESMRDEKKKKR